jgi:hypothetical protein
MSRWRVAVAVLTVGLFALACRAAELPVHSATGTVVSANDSVIIVQPRNTEGQFRRKLALKVRGTTKVYTLGTRQQGGKTVPVQRDAGPTDLQKNDRVAVIFTQVGSEYVLLQAVTPAK